MLLELYLNANISLIEGRLVQIYSSIYRRWALAYLPWLPIKVNVSFVYAVNGLFLPIRIYIEQYILFGTQLRTPTMLTTIFPDLELLQDCTYQAVWITNIVHCKPKKGRSSRWLQCSIPITTLCGGLATIVLFSLIIRLAICEQSLKEQRC